MFGSKKPEATPIAAAPFDDEGYERRFEYLAVAYLGVTAFNEGVNEYARKGWELINGCMAGTANYAYLRRAVRPTAQS